MVETFVDRVDRAMALDELRVGMVETFVDRVDRAMALDMVLGDLRVDFDDLRVDFVGPLPRTLHDEPGARRCREQRDDDQDYRGHRDGAHRRCRDATVGCR